MAVIVGNDIYDTDTGAIKLAKRILWDPWSKVLWIEFVRDDDKTTLVEKWRRDGQCNICGHCCYGENGTQDGRGALVCPYFIRDNSPAGGEANYLKYEVIDGVGRWSCQFEANKPVLCFFFPYSPEDPNENWSWANCGYSWTRTV